MARSCASWLRFDVSIGDIVVMASASVVLPVRGPEKSACTQPRSATAARRDDGKEALIKTDQLRPCLPPENAPSMHMKTTTGTRPHTQNAQ